MLDFKDPRMSFVEKSCVDEIVRRVTAKVFCRVLDYQP